MSTDPTPSLPAFSWTAKTHPGRVRKNNEDSFLALAFDHEELAFLGRLGEIPASHRELIFAVSDGMGGANAGELASKISVQTLTELISQEFHQRRGTNHASHPELLSLFIQRVHEKTRKTAWGYDECRGMGATLSVCWFTADTLHLGHIGDSRIYHFPKAGGMVQLSEDHTTVGRMRRDGKLNEREARNSPYKHQLERSIGSHPDPVEPQILSIPFEAGDRFVLCTDGITDGLWDASVEKIILTPPPYLAGINPAESLIKEAMESSGRDNLTAIVIETQPS